MAKKSALGDGNLAVLNQHPAAIETQDICNRLRDGLQLTLNKLQEAAASGNADLVKQIERKLSRPCQAGSFVAALKKDGKNIAFDRLDFYDRENGQDDRPEKLAKLVSKIEMATIEKQDDVNNVIFISAEVPSGYTGKIAVVSQRFVPSRFRLYDEKHISGIAYTCPSLRPLWAHNPNILKAHPRPEFLGLSKQQEAEFRLRYNRIQFKLAADTGEFVGYCMGRDKWLDAPHAEGDALIALSTKSPVNAFRGLEVAED